MINHQVALTRLRAQIARKEVSLAEGLDVLAEIVEALLPPRPVDWPPSPGEVWEDKAGDRWVCVRAPHPYLACIARPADDNAEEVWSGHGPMHLVQHVAPTAEEPPF